MNEPLTITDAANLIRTGELTPSELLEQCLRRIDIYEPSVQAWVYLDRERARQDAARLTDELKDHYRGPLHGIPIGVKDIIDVFDMPTGCGSKLWANSYARRDATVVERLRAAGAIILGKTVTTPYAFTDPPKTRNPWNLDRTPGGSSSGSAAAVACGMCLGALGTQTGGSLTRPASYCGVCSLKPTYGSVSTNGVLPLAPSLDHVGVMARRVRDLAILFQAINGTGDLLSMTEPTPDCLHAVDHRTWSHNYLVLGGLFEERLSEEAHRIFNENVRRIESNYSKSERVVFPMNTTELIESHAWIMANEAAIVHGERLERHPEDYPPNITKLIRDRQADVRYPNKSYLLHSQARQIVTGSLRYNQIYLAPATTDVAGTPETTGSPVLNVPASFSGVPSVSIPVPRAEGEMPFSFQFLGHRYREDHLLRAALWCEEDFVLPQRLPPVPSPDA